MLEGREVRREHDGQPVLRVGDAVNPAERSQQLRETDTLVTHRISHGKHLVYLETVSYLYAVPPVLLAGLVLDDLGGVLQGPRVHFVCQRVFVGKC